jgi:membrane-associated protease RseP (regulator of RpoE activity)
MAVAADPLGVRILLGAGDPIFPGADPKAAAVVCEVGPVALTLRLDGGRLARAFPGRPIPGGTGLALEDIVRIATIEHQRRVVPTPAERVLGGELYLVAIDGAHARLRRDVDAAALVARARRFLETMPIARPGPDVYAVGAADARAASAAAATLLTHTRSFGGIGLGPDWALGVEVRTPLADLQADRHGVIVTNPNLASRAGLQEGDRVLTVNGSPVDSLGGLLQIYLRLRAEPATRPMEVTIRRAGAEKTLLYLVR